MEGKLLDFDTFRKTNRDRCETHAQKLNDWMPQEWTNAMAGECGEACNITKKMSRLKFKKTWNKPEDLRMEVLREKLKREIGDVVIYADLLASSEGLTLEDCVRTAFNEKSEEIGAVHRL